MENNYVLLLHAIANIGLGAIMSMYLVTHYRKTLEELKDSARDLQHRIKELVGIIQEERRDGRRS